MAGGNMTALPIPADRRQLAALDQLAEEQKAGEAEQSKNPPRLSSTLRHIDR